VLIAGVCALLYRFATKRRLAWRAALRGGIVAAVVVELTPLLAGYYARAVAGRTAVQVFLVLAGLLFASYVVAQGLLIGAGLAVNAQRALDRQTARAQ
jgi:membrane protein